MLHFNGGSWTVAFLGSGQLSGVWGSAPDSVWQVGEDGTFHWDGTSLLPHVILSARDTWGFAPDEVWAIGQWGISRFGGARWELSHTAGDDRLNSTWGSEPDDVWAVGGDEITGALAWHFNGTEWRPDSTVGALGSGALFDVHGTTANDVWAVGHNILHYNGTQWSTADDFEGALPQLAVAAVAVDDVWMVGALDGSVIHRTAEGWSIMTTPAGAQLRALWANGPNDVWAVGNNGVVIRYNGHEWRKMPDVIAGAQFSGVWGWASHDVWIVGGTPSQAGALAQIRDSTDVLAPAPPPAISVHYRL
jgi:hypothetical protein